MSKVSIVIPCYNDGKYLLKTLESALNQTHKDCEIIVVDDHSSDPHTQSVLKSLGHRVKLITVPPGKKGVSAARNLGISQAEGEYILPLDADDLIDPTYIEKACRILDNNPNIGVCYCQAAYFGLKKGRWKLPPYSFETLLLRNMIFVSALFRKQLWEQASGFDENVHMGFEDHIFWLALADMGAEIFQIQEVLFHYRIKPNSRSAATGGRQNTEIAAMTTFNAHKGIYLRHVDKLYKKCIELDRECRFREKSLIWKLLSPCLHLEYSVRERIKRLIGR